jgi:hypothetical protein
MIKYIPDMSFSRHSCPYVYLYWVIEKCKLAGLEKKIHLRKDVSTIPLYLRKDLAMMFKQ